MPKSREEIDRDGRDGLAAEARELWDQPATGQTRIRLTESQADAICRIFTAFKVYTSVCASPNEPIDSLMKDLQESLCLEVGRASAVADFAAEKRASTIARRRRTRQAEAERLAALPTTSKER